MTTQRGSTKTRRRATAGPNTTKEFNGDVSRRLPNEPPWRLRQCDVAGNRINEVRKRLGLTQDALAERVQISTRQLCRVTDATTCPSLERAMAIAIALGEPIHKLWQFKVRAQQLQTL